MKVEVLNLDAMTVDELVAVNKDDNQPLAYRLYANRKALAIRARLEGNIKLAKVIEMDCDALYIKMHEQWRW